MPEDMPNDGMMDESYGNAPVEKPPEKSVDEENAESSTALVSNKILSPEGAPLKEGDEIVVTVVKNYGDESEIKYAPKGGAAGEKPSSAVGNEADEIAALDQKEGY